MSNQKFYRVRVILQPKDYQKVCLEGMYLPKNETADAKKLKQECLDYISKQIKWDKLGTTRDNCKMELTYKALDNDFIVVEDKE